MNHDDYQDWAKFHSRLFPDWQHWWKELSHGARDAMRDEFRRIFERVNLDDAKEASRKMLAGEIPICKQWEFNLVPSRIASAAREMAHERAKPSESELVGSDHRAKPTGTHAGELYREIVRRIDAGEDARSAADAVIPKVEPDKSGPRYRCAKCRDTGIVIVWHTISMKAALAGTIDNPRNRRTMAAPCECSAADAKCIPDERTAPKNWHGWRDSARYTPDRYCRCTNGDVHTPERIAELVEWVADYQAHQIKAKPNYTPQFAAFNNGTLEPAS